MRTYYRRVARFTMLSVASVSVAVAALPCLLGGCSTAGASSSPTTSLNHSGAAVVLVQLKADTSASEASTLARHLGNSRGDVTGSDWNFETPSVVRVDLGPSETVAEIDSMLPTIRKMPHVQGVTVQFK